MPTNSLHLAFFLTSIFIPFGFVLVMNGIEGLVDSLNQATWRLRLMKIGWDNCVLALGLVRGVLSNPRVISSVGGEAYVTIIAMVSVIIALSTAIGIGYWRRDPAPKGWKVFASLALSGGALATPAFVALKYGSLS